MVFWTDTADSETLTQVRLSNSEAWARHRTTRETPFDNALYVYIEDNNLLHLGPYEMCKMSSSIIRDTFSPVSIDESLSLSEFSTRYNPDEVEADKVVHTDTISGKSITYGGLREQAARGAWGLKKLGVCEGDVVMVVLPSCVSFK